MHVNDPKARKTGGLGIWPVARVTETLGIPCCPSRTLIDGADRYAPVVSDRRMRENADMGDEHLRSEIRDEQERIISAVRSATDHWEMAKESRLN